MGVVGWGEYVLKIEPSFNFLCAPQLQGISSPTEAGEKGHQKLFPPPSFSFCIIQNRACGNGVAWRGKVGKRGRPHRGGGQRYYYDFSYSVNREGGTGTSCPPVYFSTPVSLPLSLFTFVSFLAFLSGPGNPWTRATIWGEGEGKKKLLLLLLRGAKPNPPLLSHAPKNWVLARRQGRSVVRAWAKTGWGETTTRNGCCPNGSIQSSVLSGGQQKNHPPLLPPFAAAASEFY